MSKLIFLLLLIGCTKAHIPYCKSVGYFIDVYDEKGKYLKTDTSIYWPVVCGEELARFEKLSKDTIRICLSTEYMYLVIK